MNTISLTPHVRSPLAPQLYLLGILAFLARAAPAAWAQTFAAQTQPATEPIPVTVPATAPVEEGRTSFKKMSLEELMNIEVATVTTASKQAEKTTSAPATVIVVTYALTDELTAKYIYTEAFVAPAPYFRASYDRGDVLAQPNPNLKPEKANSNEINLEYNKKNVNLGLSGYYGRQSNLILVSDGNLGINQLGPVTVPDPSSLSGQSPRELVQSVNGGRSRNYGADLYGRATFGTLSPWASYSYTDFQRTLPDGTKSGLPGISRHNVRLGVTWAATPKLFITPSLVLRSTPENVVAGRLKDELDTPYEVNLHILYNINERLRAFADLRNITNHKYALGDFIGAATPQETFHGVLGIQYEF